jgi:PKD repeat protein
MKALTTLAAALATIALTACTLDRAATPQQPSGLSGTATSVSLVADPDTLTQDGIEKSTIKVTAISNGRPLANLDLRFDTLVNGSFVQDFGTLQPARIRTDANGVATAIFTPPATPRFGPIGTCQSGAALGLPGTCVDIVVSPTVTVPPPGTPFATPVAQSVQIRLAPPPPPPVDPAAPTAKFTFFPTDVHPLIDVFFNASTSTARTGRTITSYAWDFGDGTFKSGVTTSHDFGVVGVYIVTLTVTDDRGLQGVTASAVDVKP